MKAGAMDYADQASLDTLWDEIRALTANIRLHHIHEDRFIHPLLSSRVPGGDRKLQRQHEEVDRQLEDLLAHLDGIRSRDAAFEKSRQLGLEFYLALNRFIALFLEHIDEEEEHIQPTLWNLCTTEELVTAWRTIMASKTREEAMEDLGMIFSAANLEEITGLLTKFKAVAPPAAFQEVCKSAEHILSAPDWSTVVSRIGIE